MIQVIYRAVDILEYIGKAPKQRAGLAEIADTLNLKQATCANIIKSLVDRNLLEQNEKREYCFGPLMYQLTNNNVYGTELINAAQDVMHELSELLNEDSILAVLRRDKRFTLYHVESEHDLRVVNKVEKSVYASATGRLLLAYCDKKEQAAFVRRIGVPDETEWPEVKNQESLYRTLSKIREGQLSVQTAPSHIVGFAVPVFLERKMVCSLGVFLPETRLNEQRREAIVTLMRTAAQTIELNLSTGTYLSLHEKMKS